MSNWANEITANGWDIVFHPNFKDLMESRRDLEKILSDSIKAKQKIIGEINKICNSKMPLASGFPKSGHFKVLSNKSVPVCEVSITDDYRMLYYPVRPGEITIYAVLDHKGVVNFGKSANSGVHNAAMDKYMLHDMIDGLNVDLEKDDVEVDAEIERIRATLKQRVTDYDKEEEEFLKTSQECAIHKLGKYGIEIKTTPEQDDRIAKPSPLLLPGVAGTGKSTILQKRFFNLIMRHSNQNIIEKARYLTFNSRLAKETRTLLKPILPEEKHEVVDSTVKSLLDFYREMLEACGSQESYSPSQQVTYSTYFKWWKKRKDLRNFDPALAWEDYRGVIRGSKNVLESEKIGILSQQEYVKLPRERTACSDDHRDEFYDKMLGPFIAYIESNNDYTWDDQDLAREMIISYKNKKILCYVLVDEVQDLTEIQLLSLLKLIDTSSKCECSGDFCGCEMGCKNCDCFVFDAAGDISQQVYPSRFRWKDTKQLVYEELQSECQLADPLTMGYRSVTSIVDLANWYLHKMEVQNNQGNIIKESLNKEKGIPPSMITEKESNLHKILLENNLPLPQCPLIVRSETQKLSLIDIIAGGQKNKALDFDSSEYVFTIAEAKGLEFDYVLTWDITSGSDSIIKRKSHGKKGGYIESDDWNLQMEYKHVFVAITRSRIMLLGFSPTVDNKISENGVDPHLNELLSEDLIVEEINDGSDNGYNLTRFTDVKLTDEQYAKLAEDYEGNDLYSSAVGIYRKINLNHKAKYCQYKAAELKDDFIEMAKHGRDLANFQNLFSSSEMREVFTSCVNRLGSHNVRSSEALELLIFHARQIDDEETLLRAMAEKYEIDARRSKQKSLWRRAAKKWEDLGNYFKAGKAFENAKDFKESAKNFNQHGRSLDNFRKSALEYLARKSGDNQKIKIGLIIPSYFKNIEKEFKDIFDFEPNKNFYNLRPWYKMLDKFDQDHSIQTIISDIKKEQHKGNPSELAKLNFENGEITTALEIMRENGLFTKGFSTYGFDMKWTEIEAWSTANSLSTQEIIHVNKVKFKQIDLKKEEDILSFVENCILTHSNKGEGKVFDDAIGLIHSPMPLDNEDLIPILSGLLESYQSREVVDCEFGMSLHIIRLCLLRIIGSTKQSCGNYSSYDKVLLMRYCELLCKYTYHPLRAKKDQQYRVIRNIVFTLIFEAELIDPLDVLYDWLIVSDDLPKNSKLALTDLASLLVFFNKGDEDGLPSYSHGYNPESTIYSSSNRIRPKKDIIRYIYDKKFKIYKEGRRGPAGYVKRILQYRESEDGLIENDWWNKERVNECIRDIFDLSDNDSYSFDESDIIQRIEKFENLFLEREVSNLDENEDIDDESDFGTPISNEFEPVIQDEIILDTEEVEIQDSNQLEDNTQTFETSLVETMVRYSDEEDPLEYIKSDLNFTVILERSDFEILYELILETRAMIEDDKFPNDSFAASIWILGDELRKKMLGAHNYTCEDYSDFQQGKKKMLVAKLSNNEKFWKLSWAQRIISVKMSL